MLPPRPGEIEMELGVPIPGVILPESGWSRTAIKRLPPPGPLDWAGIFGRSAPLVVELGCGNGRFTLQSALARPDHDHFASDILPVVIRYATRADANQAHGLRHVRFAVKDAETIVGSFLGRASAAEIHIYHPQPYHEPRLADRRLITPRFLAGVHRALRPGGLLVIQTDNPDYWDYITRIAPVFTTFREHPEPWPDAPEGRSRREILARSRGLRIFRGLGIRRDDVTLDEALELPTRERCRRPRFAPEGPGASSMRWKWLAEPRRYSPRGVS